MTKTRQSVTRLAGNVLTSKQTRISAPAAVVGPEEQPPEDHDATMMNNDTWC